MHIKRVRSFRKAVYFQLIFMIVITAGILGYLWINSEYTNFSQESQKEEKEFINNQETIIKNEVNSQIDYIQYMRVQAEARLKEAVKNRTYEAYDIAMNIYNQNKDTKNKQEIQKLITDTLRNIRFNNGRGYYFMDTLEGDVILYPVMPESEGSNIFEIQDAKGNYALQDEINLVNEKGEGYTTGYWINPNYNDNEGYKKITFVKKFEKYNWYIGTGEYVDDVEKDIQKEILARIDVLRFGSENDNYIFINNFDGVELCNGVYKEYVGKNIWDMEDENGTKIIQEQIAIAKNSQDGGFLTHSWKTPGTTDVFQKMTFVRAVPEWNWVIGSGVQFDELVNTIQENESKMKEEVMNRIKNIVGIVVLVMLMAFILAKIFVKRIQKSLDIFFDFLNNASWNHIKIDEKKVGYSEFKDLGIAINLMINERNRIEKAIRRMNNELNVRVQQGSKELEELNLNINKNLDEKTLELRNLLNMDGLTQMYNHKYMFERLENEINKAAEGNEKICIIMFDIDYFKNVNDNYGHQCGDKVLTRIASILKEQIREVDIVGRYGGEEFIAIITNADMEIGYKIVEGIRKKIMDMQFKEKGLSVTISGGIVEYCSQTAIEIVKSADDKLYEAKRKGRNRIQK